MPLPKRGPGRPKGASNKITRDIREAITEAFERAGGVDYLVKLSQTNPQVFCGLVGKVVPQQLNHAGSDGGPLVIERRVVG